MTRVQMNFGDGTFKIIEMSEGPEEAAEAAAEWVKDNAWFEALDEEGEPTGEEARL